MSPNVATTFAGGGVKIYFDGAFKGNAKIGGAWNGATRWIFDVSAAALGPGSHVVKVLFDDGVGGSSLAGVRFRGERSTNALGIDIF